MFKIKKEFYSIKDEEFGKICGFHIFFNETIVGQRIYRQFINEGFEIYIYNIMDSKEYKGFLDIPKPLGDSLIKDFKKEVNNIYKKLK
jgi:hypothetical protein